MRGSFVSPVQPVGAASLDCVRFFGDGKWMEERSGWNAMMNEVRVPKNENEQTIVRYRDSDEGH